MRRRLNVKLVFGTLGGLLMVSATTYAVHEFQIRHNAHQLLERADRAVADKDDDRALILFPQYLSFVPNDPDANQKYAEVLDRRAGNDERLQLVLLMDQILRIKPNEDALRLRLVHNLISLDRLAEALEHLQRLLTRGQDKAEVHHMIGWARDAKKDYAEAAESFAMAVKLDPKRIDSHALLAEVLSDRLHRTEAALEALDDMVKANPDSHRAYLLRARFQRRRGDEQAAARDLQAAVKLRPGDAGVIFEVADAAGARGQGVMLARLLDWLMARREFKKALSALAQYEQYSPLTPDLAKLGADAALGMGDPPSVQLAVKWAALAVTLPSRDYRDFLWLAPIHRAAGDNAKAEQLLRTALELANHAPDAWIAWLEHLTLTKQHSLALQEIERLKTELPADRRALTLARCYDAMHMQDAAAKAYEDVLKNQPNDLALLSYAADFFRGADRPDKAKALYERLLDPELGAPAELLVDARRHLATIKAATVKERLNKNAP